MISVWEIIIFVCGIIVGCSICAIIRTKSTIGHLRVDHSIPEEEPYLFLELFKNISDFTKKKYVVLKVRVEDFISQK